MNHYPGVASFQEAVHSRYRRLRNKTAQGSRAIGYFCTYTPVEIIHACGFIPVRIWGGPGRTEDAHAYVPSFICPFMRQSLEKALHGEFDFLSGLVQGYTCDVACGLLNIWKENIPLKLYHSMALPYNDTDISRSFLRSSLLELAEKLSGTGGNFSESALEASLDLYDRIRVILDRLSKMRMQRRLPLTASDFLSVIQAGFVMEPDEYLAMLKELMSGLADSGTDISGEGVPVLVSGSVIEDADIFFLMEELGFRIVADDLCTGFRSFTPVSGKGGSPLERLMDRIMNRFPCPSRSHARDRVPLIRDLVAGSGAKGVVFVFQKFCSPHLADHPMVSGALAREGIPSIAIEMDEADMMEAQIQTRLETFSGMLRG